MPATYAVISDFLVRSPGARRVQGSRQDPSPGNRRRVKGGSPAGNSKEYHKKRFGLTCISTAEVVSSVAHRIPGFAIVFQGFLKIRNPIWAALKSKPILEKVPPDPLQSRVVSETVGLVDIHCPRSLLGATVVERSQVAMTEKSNKGRPKSERALSRAKKSAMTSDAAVTEVWEYWISVMRAGSKRKPVLDSTRRQIIGAAIHDYEVQGCKDAIDGCRLSEFHMGRNKNNKRYDSVELIFRDSEHVEKFLEILDKSNQEDGDPW